MRSQEVVMIGFLGFSRRWLRATAAVSLAAGAAYAVPATAAHAASLTVVTIQFDDGNADVIQWISGLNNHGFPATFYVNSGTIGTAGHLTWDQLTQLNAAGNDIGSHTIDHVNLKKLKLADARFQVCQDRVNIASHGFQPESFAYPFGDLNSTAEQVVQYCGDNSGRGVTGVNDKTVFAETIPPLDPFDTRTPADPKQGTTVATIEGYVTAAEQNGGGWVQLTFHHICSGCDAYSITAANMQALLDWLSTQVPGGQVVVESTRQVIGGPYITPFCC
jgi:peptidoglycan/xylan/chitin deacetylase (PgdA/CDA1 family)